MRSATRKKIGRDKAYLAWLHTLPCAVCVALLCAQSTRTEAAHVGDRGLSQKSPDRQAIPLCGFEHHREGKYSAHKLQRRFWSFHGLDRDDIITKLNAQYDAERETEAA